MRECRCEATRAGFEQGEFGPCGQADAAVAGMQQRSAADVQRPQPVAGQDDGVEVMGRALDGR
jgi:hypothetical protein